MVVLAPKAIAHALPRVIEPGFWRSMEAVGGSTCVGLAAKSFFDEKWFEV